MAQSPKIWRKKDGQWVKTTPDVTKADVGLGNVANYPPTNSATDGSSSKYATGAAVKAAYDRATQALNNANAATSFGSLQTGPEYVDTSTYWDNRNRGYRSQAEIGMSSFMAVAKDRSDTFLCGFYRRNNNGRVGLRARYRRT